LYGQLGAVALVVSLIFQYVATQPNEQQADSMGAIAATAQIASMAGGLYDMASASGFILSNSLLDHTYLRNALST
jgi:hypothetical protein